MVPNIKNADTMDFAEFWRPTRTSSARRGSDKLTVDDFPGTTISLTNPGTLGTVHSVPRLMAGQGTIIGVGAMDYPAEFQGASPETLARQAISKIMTLTSTYDHRIIQGAQSGEFLGHVHELLLGEHGSTTASSPRCASRTSRSAGPRTSRTSHDDDLNKAARVQELIHAYRVRGHLMADTDPLEYHQRKHPDLDVTRHGLTLWDLDREFPTGGFGGTPFAKLRAILGRAARLVLPHRGHRVHAHPGPRAACRTAAQPAGGKPLMAPPFVAHIRLSRTRSKSDRGELDEQSACRMRLRHGGFSGGGDCGACGWRGRFRRPLSCRGRKRAADDGSGATEQIRKVFRGMGIVTAIEPAGSLTINHEPIEGLMPAMEMTFSVNPRALTKGVRPGDRIEFSVEGKTYTIVDLKVVGHTE